MVDYAWSHAVISDETHKIIRESCNFDSNDTWSNDDCIESVDELIKQYKEIDIFSLYTSVCIGGSASSDDRFTQIMFRPSSKKVNDFRIAKSCWYYFSEVAIWPCWIFERTSLKLRLIMNCFVGVFCWWNSYTN